MKQTIECQNCTIKINQSKHKYVANIIWNDQVQQQLVIKIMTDISYESAIHIIPHHTLGFYYLANNQIIYLIDSHTQKIVISSLKHMFNNIHEDDLMYFPKSDVLIVTFLGGDHDYIWWMQLSIYDQDGDLIMDNPCYYNGRFNDSLTLIRINDRYAMGTYLIESEDENDDDDEENDDDDSNRFNYQEAITIIFDTKEFKITDYNFSDLIQVVKVIEIPLFSEQSLDQLQSNLKAQLELD